MISAAISLARSAAVVSVVGDRWVIDCPFPARFDAEAKRWLLEEGAIGWDEVMVRWKGRGPMNGDYVERLQRGYRSRLAVAA